MHRSGPYSVFVRNWYKLSPPDRYTGKRALVPAYGAHKTWLAHGVDYDTARAICEEYNQEHAPGRFSRKAEFTS